MCICMCMCVQRYKCVQSVQDYLPHSLSTLTFYTGSLSESSTHWLAGLFGQRAPGIPCLRLPCPPGADRVWLLRSVMGV